MAARPLAGMRSHSVLPDRSARIRGIVRSGAVGLREGRDRANLGDDALDLRARVRVVVHQARPRRFVKTDAADKLRAIDGQSQRDHPAVGVGYEVDRLKIRGLEQRGEIVRVVPHGVRPHFAAAEAVTPTVVGQNLESTREPGSHRVPAVVIGPRTVDERCRVAPDRGPFVENLSVGNVDYPAPVLRNDPFTVPAGDADTDPGEITSGGPARSRSGDPRRGPPPRCPQTGPV